MADKNNNSKGTVEKNTDEHKPAQVAEPEQHLGATADEDIPQDDLKQGTKEKAGDQDKAGQGCDPCKDK